MSKRKKIPPLIADPKAVKKAAGEIENQIAQMCQAVPASLRDGASRAVALRLVYRGEAKMDIPTKIQFRNKKEADSWLTSFISPLLKAWRPFGVELECHYWHGNMFIVILKKK